MTFANPTALLGGLLAIPIVLVYLRPARLRREVTATGMFWERVLAERRGRAAWRRWRRPISLAVQLLVLAFLVFALAEPLTPKPRRIVLVIDNAPGPASEKIDASRLHAARAAAEEVIAGLRPCDRVALLSSGGAVAVRCNFTAEASLLHDALDAIAPVAGPSQSKQAEQLGQRMLGHEPGGQVIVLPADRPEDTSAIDRVALPLRPPWWVCLIACGVLLLTVEWGLYQRRWTS
jgi:hypothetical protein